MLFKILDNIFADFCFTFVSKWAYILAVVLKLECPSHACISFKGIPLANNKLAQLCLKSWNLIIFKLLFFSNLLKCFVIKSGAIILPKLSTHKYSSYFEL